MALLQHLQQVHLQVKMVVTPVVAVVAEIQEMHHNHLEVQVDKVVEDKVSLKVVRTQGQQIQVVAEEDPEVPILVHQIQVEEDLVL